MGKGFKTKLKSTVVFGALIGLSLSSLPSEVQAQDSNSSQAFAQRSFKSEQFARAAYGTPSSENSTNESDALRSALEGQQEKFINEILRLKRKLKILEARTAVEEDSNLAEENRQIQERISSNDLELRAEIRREQNRTAKAIKELEQYKSLYREARVGKKGHDELLVEIQRGRKDAKKQDKEIAELTTALERAKSELASFREVKKSFRETRNAAEQLQLALQAKGQVETDNEFLRKKVAELESSHSKRKGVIATREAEVAELTANVSELRKALLTLKKENDSLSGKLKSKTEQYELLVVGSKEALETIATLEKNIAAKDERISKLEEELKEYQAAKQRLSSIESKNRELLSAEQTSQEQIKTLEQKLAALTTSEETLRADYSRTKIALESKETELSAAKRHLSKALGDAALFKAKAESSAAAASKIPELSNKINSLEQSIASHEKTNQQCSADLAAKKVELARIPELERALVAAKGELLMKQTEVRLFRSGKPALDAGGADSAAAGARSSKVAKSRSVSRIDKLLSGKGPAFDAMRQMQGLPPVAATNDANDANDANDVTILEVTGNKVNLRTGPGEENSPFMQVKKGTRLTVEHRQGEWVRVLAPTGGRAWIRSDLVRELTPQGPQVAASNSTEQAAPRKPARRSLREAGAVVPFGEVKIAGRGKSDLDSLAMEQIKMLKINPSKK